MENVNLLDYFLKWFIPFACAGLFAVTLKPLIEIIKYGNSTKRKEEFHRNFVDEIRPIQEQIDLLRQESQTADLKTQEVIKEMHNEIKQATIGLREALLETHLRDLILDSKKYLDRGWLTADEWDQYNTRYNTYHLLGGNGHMDPWYPKVKQLPIRSEEK